MATLPLTFEVPAHPEPIEIVRLFALGLRDGISRAGEHYPAAIPSEFDELVRIVVQVPRDDEAYLVALWTLVYVDLWCLRAARHRLFSSHPRPYPPVYQMACYAPDPIGVELWGCTTSLFLRGSGDCEDIACARIAERLSVGDTCRPRIDTTVAPDGSTVHHILIENPDGTEEDPSDLLGMNLGEAHGDRTIARCRVRPAPRRQEVRKRDW